jgi:hypothetical protein
MVSPISANVETSPDAKIGSENHNLLSIPIVIKYEVTVKNIPHKCFKSITKSNEVFSVIDLKMELAKKSPVTVKIIITANLISGSL